MSAVLEHLPVFVAGIVAGIAGLVIVAVVIFTLWVSFTLDVSDNDWDEHA